MSSVPASASSSADGASRSSPAQDDTHKYVTLRYRNGRRQDTYKGLEVPTADDPRTVTGSPFTSHGSLASNVLAGFSQHQTSYAGADLALTDGGERLIWTKAKARRNKQDDRTITAILDRGFPRSEASYTLNPSMYQLTPGDLTKWGEVLRAIPTDDDSSQSDTARKAIKLSAREDLALQDWKSGHEVFTLESGLSEAETLRQVHAQLEKSYQGATTVETQDGTRMLEMRPTRGEASSSTARRSTGTTQGTRLRRGRAQRMRRQRQSSRIT